METVYSVLIDRAERGLADLLISVADYFYCKGAGIIDDAPAYPRLADLLRTLDARYQAEIMAARGWLDPPILADELPGWLLTLKQQADSVEPPPIEGWPV